MESPPEAAAACSTPCTSSRSAPRSQRVTGGPLRGPQSDSEADTKRHRYRPLRGSLKNKLPRSGLCYFFNKLCLQKNMYIILFSSTYFPWSLNLLCFNNNLKSSGFKKLIVGSARRWQKLELKVARITDKRGLTLIKTDKVNLFPVSYSNSI